MRIDYTKTSPAGVKALGSVYGYITQSGLDPALVELTYLRISQINGCAYCLDMHTRPDAPGRGRAEARAGPGLARAGNLFSDREKAALAWAESVTRVADTHVPDDAFRAAAAVFEEKELADLTIAIGLMNTFNRLAISFRRAPEGAV